MLGSYLRSLILFSPLFLAFQVNLKAEIAEYTHAGTKFEGRFFAADKAKAPGLILVPDCLGITAEVEMQAQRFQKLGYSVLVADIYGRDIRPKSEKEGARLAEKFKKDRALLLERIRLAVVAISSKPNVDKDRLAVIGYKFGGLAAVELARAGDALKAVVAVQTSLDSPAPKHAANFKAKLLSVRTANDPYILKKDVDAFEAEIQKSKIEYELVTYGSELQKSSRGADTEERAFARAAEFLDKSLN